MQTIHDLLKAVEKIPKDQLKAGVRPEKRPDEMKLLDSILSQKQIDEFGQREVKIARACLPTREILFRINGTVKSMDVRVCRFDGEPTIQLNGAPVDSIYTVDELREWLEQLMTPGSY